ncbi:MAG: nucleoside-diphosphate-sugar epimerase [Myxococcota bacterium]|jgi:nucleoside-diphosphate-sugar epimerase
MRVIITGTTGFLGSHIARSFVDADHDVHGADRRPDAAPVPSVAANLLDPDSLREAFTGADVVVANAALAPGRATASAQDFDDANITGTRNTLDAAVAAGVRRVVLISTIAVYRTSLRHPMDEGHQTRDGTERFDWNALTTRPGYSRSKAAAEKVAWTYADRLELAVLRPGPIYGPRDGKLTVRYHNWAARRVIVAPTVRLPHVHGADVGDLAVLAATDDAAVGEAFNVAGDHLRVADVLRHWRPIAGGGRVVPVPVPLGVVIDDAKARRVLGWSPRPWQERVEDAAAWAAAR